MHGPTGKRERALGVNLLLKGARSQGPKAAIVRRPYKPGAHGKTGRRKTLSDFGRQLQEKQKFKLTYGLNERNLKQVVSRANKMKGSTATHIIEILESRLGNIVYRLGFAPSRAAARQLVIHGHILVNGKRSRSPGYHVKVGDTVSIRSGSLTKGAFRELKETLKHYEAPAWLAVDPAKLEGKVLSGAGDTAVPFEINLLVESFSK